MRAALGRIALTGLAALLGWAFGWLASGVAHVLPKPGGYPFLAESLPLPHHVPKYPGGLSFRFAMTHDVIHERFPKHGPAYYRERNRRAREALAVLDPDDPAAFPLVDDLAVGLEKLGQSSEAAALEREKLGRQERKGLSGRALYTTYANLGTFLIHGSFQAAIAGDKAAKARFREGVGFVRKSVEVNPEAHFGREQWQAAIAEFLLAAADNPKLLTTFDCLGNRLDLSIEDILNREMNWVETGYGHAVNPAFTQGKVDASVPAFFRPEARSRLEDPAHWKELSPIRDSITKVGAEREWDTVPVPSHRAPVAFDEPVLGIIGMWRQGGGASPHFALALGETMLRVGQRDIAWSAYERAARLANRFWPDPVLQKALRDHCRKRQEQIESTYRFGAPGWREMPGVKHARPPVSQPEIAGLRARFDAELAYGERYQHDYQAYEAAKIAAGAPITDPHAYDAFFAGRAPIASPVGKEEWFVRVPNARMAAYGVRRQRAWRLFGAGVAAMAMALFLRWQVLHRARAAAREAAAPVSPMPVPVLDHEAATEPSA